MAVVATKFPLFVFPLIFCFVTRIKETIMWGIFIFSIYIYLHIFSAKRMSTSAQPTKKNVHFLLTLSSAFGFYSFRFLY